MDEALRELYQEVILDHYRHPRNFGKVDDEARSVLGNNPLCGDRIEVHVRLREGRIEDVSFEGVGCAISTASASMMTEAVKGKPVEEALVLAKKFHDMITEGAVTDDLGSLEVFQGVREYPSRIKCATLGWHALRAALEQSQEVVTTEAAE
jgi:nitrogen fixation NifU-like protein